ncbi:hypothetical protein [Aliiroseovarius sp. 2305UL8-7]|uniref:hypothetical protein n=1 Tax=Aliiroseovarius conchicola TaxID=3121637 RepID=UPI0035286C02
MTGYEVFEDKLDLPDPNDNHVLAAAISTSASVIVTDNLVDFPIDALAPHAIDAISADDFIADTIELDRIGNKGWCRKVDRVLQPKASSFRPWRQTGL